MMDAMNYLITITIAGAIIAAVVVIMYMLGHPTGNELLKMNPQCPFYFCEYLGWA